MRVDLYTKAVLTVIAGCLVYMCLGGPSLLPTLEAQRKKGDLPQGPISRVVIVGSENEFGSFSRIEEFGIPVKTVQK